EAEPVGRREYHEHLFRKVEELELSVRAANCLKTASIRTVADLVQKTESDLLKTKNVGKKSLNEIKAILGAMDLSLGMRLDPEELERLRPHPERTIESWRFARPPRAPVVARNARERPPPRSPPAALHRGRTQGHL